MKIEDVEWSERTVRVIGKGDKQRLVPLTPNAAKSLWEYLGNRNSGPIFLRHEHVQAGGVQLQRGHWFGCWRENLRLPDGTVQRVRRSKCLGSVKKLKRGSSAQKVLDGILASLPAEQLRCLVVNKIQPLGPRDVERIIKKVCIRAGSPTLCVQGTDGTRFSGACLAGVGITRLTRQVRPCDCCIAAQSLLTSIYSSVR
jgi:hypothetical protein